MSAIGTSYAAGVAQTAHHAQLVAREKDKQRADRAADQAQLSRLFAERLQSAEDAADPDAELPDRQAPGYEQLYRQRLEPPTPQAADAPPDAQPPRPIDGIDAFGMPTFHHIDVKA